MQRRRLLQLGLASGAILALAGTGAALLKPGLSERGLSTSGRDVFRAIARAVLDGSLPLEAPNQHAAIEAHLTRLDATLQAFPNATRAELSQLLAILGSAPGRLAFTGLSTAWNETSVPDIQRALQSMRHSSLVLRQQAYHALRDLTNAAWYADRSSWAAIGYPGPRPT